MERGKHRNKGKINDKFKRKHKSTILLKSKEKKNNLEMNSI